MVQSVIMLNVVALLTFYGTCPSVSSSTGLAFTKLLASFWRESGKILVSFPQASCNLLNGVFQAFFELPKSFL